MIIDDARFAIAYHIAAREIELAVLEFEKVTKHIVEKVDIQMLETTTFVDERKTIKRVFAIESRETNKFGMGPIAWAHCENKDAVISDRCKRDCIEHSLGNVEGYSIPLYAYSTDKVMT